MNLFSGIEFAYPGFFWLLLIIPLMIAYYWWRNQQLQGTLGMSTTKAFALPASALKRRSTSWAPAMSKRPSSTTRVIPSSASRTCMSMWLSLSCRLSLLCRLSDDSVTNFGTGSQRVRSNICPGKAALGCEAAISAPILVSRGAAARAIANPATSAALLGDGEE